MNFVIQSLYVLEDFYQEACGVKEERLPYPRPLSTPTYNQNWRIVNSLSPTRELEL